MSQNSKIEWTDHTFNPWWGCVKVSDGCRECYAETFSKRVGHNVWGPAATTPRRFFGDARWREPLRWNADAEKAGERARVFCASMADVFEDHPEVGPHRERLFSLMAETLWLDWLLLTKRPENIMRMVPESWQGGFPPNVWMGTSTEHQAAADERIPHLLAVPAAVRFLSAEPLLGPIDLTKFQPFCRSLDGFRAARGILGGTVDWVIAGGESGPKARPMHPDWARSLRDQCISAGVAFHFKQWGEWAPTVVAPGGDLGGDLRRGHTRHLHGPGNPEGHFRKGDAYVSRVGKHNAGRELDGRTWDQFPNAAVPA